MRTPSRRLRLLQATAAGTVVLLGRPSSSFQAHPSHVRSGTKGQARQRRHANFQWPLSQAVHSETLRSSSPDVDEATAIGIDIPSGLRRTLLANAHETIHKRYWIVDNSGSMSLEDGHCLLSADEDDEFGDDSCRRWDEVSETVLCHTHLASALGAPSEFKLLNPPKHSFGPLIRGPQSFRVGYGLNTPKQSKKDCKRANNIMTRNEPSGRTPLPDAIREVQRDIVDMLPILEENGSRVAVIIATDGQNVNKHNAGLEVNEEERQEDLVAALESLQDLPVQVVIRLCTDFEPTVNFYNELDQRLDWLDVDVLDDHVSEAQEVFEHNPWLNYARPLHRMREMGQAHRLFDLLDEKSFCRYEVREFCALLFGCSDLLYCDWHAFAGEVDHLQKKERKQLNPITKSLGPWIDGEKLDAVLP